MFQIIHKNTTAVTCHAIQAVAWNTNFDQLVYCVVLGDLYVGEKEPIQHIMYDLHKTRWNTTSPTQENLLIILQKQNMKIAWASSGCAVYQHSLPGLMEAKQWSCRRRISCESTHGGNRGEPSNHSQNTKSRNKYFITLLKKKVFHYVSQVAEPHRGDTSSIPQFSLAGNVEAHHSKRLRTHSVTVCYLSSGIFLLQTEGIRNAVFPHQHF